MCMCSSWGGIGGEGMSGLGFTNLVGTGGVLDVYLCCLGTGSGIVGGVMSGFFCVDGRSMYMYIVLGVYLRILHAPSLQSGCTISISISNPDLFYE